MELKELYVLWDKLGDIPTDNNDCIEEKFEHFNIGTFREDIWHWFEDQNKEFSDGLTMSGVRVL